MSKVRDMAAQLPFVSGQNIKTVNNSSLLGSGNITIAGGGGSSITLSGTAPSTPANGDLWINTTDNSLSFWYDNGTTAQWYAPKSDIASGFLKTISGNSLLGSGDVAVKTINGQSIFGSGDVSAGGISTGKSIAMSIVFGG